MAGPKDGASGNKGLTVGEMGKLAVELLPEPMQRVAGFAEKAFSEVSAAQPQPVEESRAPASAPETGPAAQQRESARPTDGLAAVLSGAGFGALTADGQRARMDSAIEQTERGTSPPKPPGM